MEENKKEKNVNKFSLNNVVNQTYADIAGYRKKIALSSLTQYVLFLVTYLLTKSILISFIVYSIFLPSQVKYLTNLKESKLEDVFVIGKKLAPYLLLSLFFTFVFGVFLAVLIFPVVIFFANYALVFDVMGKENLSVGESFKKAQSEVKGYRGKMAVLCLVFLLLLLLFIGFGILIMGLLSLYFPTLSVNSNFIWSFINIPSFYFMGTFAGVSVFLIYMMPIELICISNMKKEIAKDKENKAQEMAKVEEENKTTSNEKREEEKEETESQNDGEDNPSDYIF